MPIRREFLQKHFLRITPRTELNDPYDFLPFSSDIEETKLRYKAMSKGRYEAPLRHITDNHLNGMGVISFTEAVDSILLWSHYANGHRGIAIQFDATNEFFKDLERVRYTTQRPDLRKEFPNVMGTELFFKSDQWMYEKEWRIAESFCNCTKTIDLEGKKDYTQLGKPLHGNKTELAMLEVPSTAIKKVIFGCSVYDDAISLYMSSAKENTNLSHIEFEKVVLNPDKYELEFEVIRE